MQSYLADSSVISAIHAKDIQTGKSKWAYDQNVDSMLPYYRSLIKSKKKLLIYSGLVDIQVSTFF